MIWDLVVWVLIWLTTWGIFILMRKKGIDYIHKPVLTGLYFSTVACFVLYFYRGLLINLKVGDTYVWATLLFVFVFEHVIYNLLKSAKSKTKPKNKYLSNLFDINHLYLVTKRFDLFFQQSMIVVLTLMLSEVYSIGMTLIIFLIVFSGTHFPVLVLLGKRWGKIFFGATIVASLLFPTIILTVKSGFVYTYIMHTMFYTLAAISVKMGRI